MARKHIFGALPFLIIVLTLVLSGCKMPYSTAPKATATKVKVANPTFPSTLAAPTDPMALVESMITGTAMASSGSAQGATAQVVVVTPGSIVVSAVPSSTLPVIPVNPTTSGSGSVVVNTPVPGSVPATYTLKAGEFPYCIARRYNVNPDELLFLNGLPDGSFFEPGLTLRLPQTGNPFPAARALRSHPGTYTVVSSDETPYSIACLYGDVDPAAIASANGIAAGSTLTIGTNLQIP